jgi:hypothetical protein
MEPIGRIERVEPVWVAPVEPVQTGPVDYTAPPQQVTEFVPTPCHTHATCASIAAAAAAQDYRLFMSTHRARGARDRAS